MNAQIELILDPRSALITLSPFSQSQIFKNIGLVLHWVATVSHVSRYLQVPAEAEEVESSNDAAGDDPDGREQGSDAGSVRNEKLGLWLPKESYRSTLADKTSQSTSVSTSSSPRVALSDDRKAHLLAKLRELDIKEGVQVNTTRFYLSLLGGTVRCSGLMF